MADYTPLFRPGQDVTFRTTADVRGGRLVEITGDTAVAEAAAGSTKVAGVALFDAASGVATTVASAGMHPLIATGAIAAGDRVAAAANGTVATGTTATIGLCISGAAGGGVALIKLDK